MQITELQSTELQPLSSHMLLSRDSEPRSNHPKLNYPRLQGEGFIVSRLEADRKPRNLAMINTSLSRNKIKLVDVRRLRETLLRLKARGFNHPRGGH